MFIRRILFEHSLLLIKAFLVLSTSFKKLKPALKIKAEKKQFQWIWIELKLLIEKVFIEVSKKTGAGKKILKIY